MDEPCNGRHDELMCLLQDVVRLESSLATLLAAYTARYCPERDPAAEWTTGELLEMLTRLTELLASGERQTLKGFGKGDFPARRNLAPLVSNVLPTDEA